MRSLYPLLFVVAVGCASCKIPIDSSSLSAAEAGHSTLVLGSCAGGFNVGWADCLVERRSALPFPKLEFFMTNPGEYAVSDCELGVFKSGSAAAPELVSLDLESLKAQAERNGFCLLKVETIEKFVDSTGQTRRIFMRGGFFLELVEPGYFPTPGTPDIAFCYNIQRTSKGRTKIKPCRPN